MKNLFKLITLIYISFFISHLGNSYDQPRLIGGNLDEVNNFAAAQNIQTYEDLKKRAGKELLGKIKNVSGELQEALKVAGDWEIYPFAVHDLIANGRVALDGRTVYIDGNPMPEYGYRMDEAG